MYNHAIIKCRQGGESVKPRIFVSSTFYDLKYIREDLSNFIRMHDFEPIMFEDGDIGYTSGKKLDESCYDTMKKSDMAILIIGGEYGSPANGENVDEFKEYLSVTRREFRTAVDNGIPLYVLIDAKVYSEYGIYEENLAEIEKKNINLKFKSTKSINVFRFIKEIKGLTSIPIQEFIKISDIKDYLGRQWADMFKLYLNMLRENDETDKLKITLDGLNSIVTQMQVMLDGIGKKIFNNTSDISYDDIVDKQLDLKSKALALDITTSIKIYTWQFVDGESSKIVDGIISSLQEYYSEVKELVGKEDGGVEEEELVDVFFNVFSEHGIQVASVTGTFVINWEQLEELNSNVELRDKVRSYILKNKRKLFSKDIDFDEDTEEK